MIAVSHGFGKSAFGCDNLVFGNAERVSARRRDSIATRNIQAERKGDVILHIKELPQGGTWCAKFCVIPRSIGRLLLVKSEIFPSDMLRRKHLTSDNGSCSDIPTAVPMPLARLQISGTIVAVTRPFPRHSRIRQTVQPCRGRLIKNSFNQLMFPAGKRRSAEYE